MGNHDYPRYGFADDRPLLRRALADPVANHYLTRGDADTDRQCGAIVGDEPADHLRDFNPGPDRAFGIVLVRVGIAASIPLES